MKVDCFSRLPLAAWTLLWWAPTSAIAAPVDENLRIVAESWPLDGAHLAPQTATQVFEKWRSQTPPAKATTLSLETLAIPARESLSMVRVRGVILPPKSGRYAFRIDGTRENKFKSPDEAEMWLQDPRTGEWKMVQRTGNPNQKSGRMMLEQGVPLRFEFQTMGTREVSVAWESVDSDPVTGAAVVTFPNEVIPASRIRLRSAMPDDSHDDGLLDSWKRKWGLNVDSGEGPEGPWGDPDSDGLLNWQEQSAGSNPLAVDAEGHEGLVRWELWHDIPGKYVFDLTRSASFPPTPHQVRYRGRLEVPMGNGNNYGSRLRGWIKAPATGEYTLMLIADDSAELWLGSDESWVSKRRVARAERNAVNRWVRGTAEGEKPLSEEQTAKVMLEAGKKYYVEVLHKQDSALDHCAVAWVQPRQSGPEVIGAKNLVAWKPAADDLNDDGLPDAWQQSAGLAAEGIEPLQRTAFGDPDNDGITNWADERGQVVDCGFL